MTIDMNDSGIVTLDQLKRFLLASKGWKFKGLSRADKYQWIEDTVRRFAYFSLGKKDKRPVRRRRGRSFVSQLSPNKLRPSLIALVKKVAEVHHGSVYAKSQLQKGSAFTIVLPL